MDIMNLLEGINSVNQLMARLWQIQELQDEGFLLLTSEECEELIDRCEEICHKHGIEIEITLKENND